MPIAVDKCVCITEHDTSHTTCYAITMSNNCTGRQSRIAGTSLSGRQYVLLQPVGGPKSSVTRAIQPFRWKTASCATENEGVILSSSSKIALIGSQRCVHYQFAAECGSHCRHCECKAATLSVHTQDHASGHAAHEQDRSSMIDNGLWIQTSASLARH